MTAPHASLVRGLRTSAHGAALTVLLLAFTACRHEPGPKTGASPAGTYEADVPGYAGTGARLTLQLERNGRYHLLVNSHHAFGAPSGEYDDQVGRWTAGENGRIRLVSADSGVILLDQGPGGVLRLTAAPGLPPAATDNPMLVRISDRAEGGVVPPVRTLFGWYGQGPETAFFGECPDGIIREVAPQGEYRALRAAYDAFGKPPGARVLVYIKGYYRQYLRADGTGTTPSVVPVRFIGIHRAGDCGP
jgi:hypothetical protein